MWKNAGVDWQFFFKETGGELVNRRPFYVYVSRVKRASILHTCIKFNFYCEQPRMCFHACNFHLFSHFCV